MEKEYIKFRKKQEKENSEKKQEKELTSKWMYDKILFAAEEAANKNNKQEQSPNEPFDN